MKATAVLFPLLGMTNVSFFILPRSRESQLAYRVTNAVLHSVQVLVLCKFVLFQIILSFSQGPTKLEFVLLFQGIFVSVIYCFMNSEVGIPATANLWSCQLKISF